MKGELLSATELAVACRTTPRALRFYESKGLLAPRRAGRRRVYDSRDRARLQLILRGKRLGFTLAEIKEYLELYDADPQHVEQLRHLEQAVGARIEGLEHQREALEQMLAELTDIRRQVSQALTDRERTHYTSVRPRIRPKRREPGPVDRTRP